ncbi:glycosyltransferase [Empedobacter sp. UBA7248]|uniref:glycosyltransferase n=1 Tax=Empedobacter sp. UBA7248 TaxID=1946448 RepID=UPI0025C4FBD8|nr:glycosyltransferase [Empedobacter sp. UBA7248]
MNISVCLATYNGEKYIEEQLRSIIDQLIEGDELLILDDCSTDNTLEVIKKIDSRFIRIHENNTNVGHVKTFEKLITMTKNEYIFLSDQDDIWNANKRKTFLQVFESKDNVSVITSNMDYIDNIGNKLEFDTFKIVTSNSSKYYKNILDIFLGKSLYYGSTMAFRKELKSIILPFPSCLESHDIWIGLIANFVNGNYFIESKTLFRRLHENNVTKNNRTFLKRIYSRYIFLRNIFEILKRLNK